MLRMRELVDRAPDVEHSPTFMLCDLLAPVESEGLNEPVVDNPPKEDYSVMIRVICNRKLLMYAMYLNKS